jgi:hypothetical protein
MGKMTTEHETFDEIQEDLVTVEAWLGLLSVALASEDGQISPEDLKTALLDLRDRVGTARGQYIAQFERLSQASQ